MFHLKSVPDPLPAQRGIQNYFGIAKFTFNCIGIEPTSEKRTFYNPILNCIPMVLLMPLSILMVIYAWERRQDLDLVTDILVSFFVSVLAVIKTACFVWNKKKIVKLVKRIWMWNLKASGEEFNIIVEENKTDRFYSAFYSLWLLTASVMSLLSPVLVAFVYYFNGFGFMSNIDHPIKAAYHLVVSPKSYNGYLLVFVWNFIVTFYIFNNELANVTLFSWFAHNISAQFRILSLRFKTTALTVRKHGDEIKFTKSVISQIEFHNRVIELANNFNEVFSLTVFFNYFVYFFEIAFLVFQLARVGEFSRIVFFILCIVSASLQLMIYCRGGQRIIDESSSIAVAIYEHFQWHNMSVKSRKLLLLPMLRAQKPCSVTGFFLRLIGHYFYGSVLKVVKTSGSFFTMLKSIES